MSRVKYINVSSNLYKFLIFSKIIIEKEFKSEFGMTFIKDKYNPYNPLTYIWMIMVFLILLFINIFLDFKSFIVNFKKGFKYN
jgi:hypothetical protein